MKETQGTRISGSRRFGSETPELGKAKEELINNLISWVIIISNLVNMFIVRFPLRFVG